MRLAVIIKMLGILLIIFSITFIPPVVVSLIYQDGGLFTFLFTFVIIFLSGLALWLIFRQSQHELKTRDGFLIVALCWSVLSFFGAIPFMMMLYPKISFAGAIFETMSGLTSTGASVLSGLDHMPHALLYYRQQLQFLGGMGVIVLAVAIMPMLGIGGMQLYAAEIAGPLKKAKLKPRLAQTARALWYIYVGLVAICAFLYWGAGMHPFDAICESFSTVATGGFSIHDASFAFYHSHLIDMICVVFMILGAINFGVHYHFIHQRKLSCYYKDPETKTYLFIIIAITLLSTVVLLNSSDNRFFNHAFFNSLFNVTSIATTTGFTTAPFYKWPSFLPFLIMSIALIGGCAGSTAGGLKVIRFIILKQQAGKELKRLIHPHLVSPIKVGNEVVPPDIVRSVWGFTVVYIATCAILLFLLMASGLDLPTSFGALATCITGTGAGIAGVGQTFAVINDAGRWLLTFTMLLGRLEIFTILLLFTPAFWRQ